MLMNWNNILMLVWETRIAHSLCRNGVVCKLPGSAIHAVELRVWSGEVLRLTLQ